MWAILAGYLCLLVLRMLAGAAQAGLLPCSAAVLSRWMPVTRLAMSGGILNGAMLLGAIIAAFLTGILLECGVGWRWLFVMYALPGGLWALYFHRWFRDSPQDHSSVTPRELEFLLAESQVALELHSKQSGKLNSESSMGTPWLRLATSRAMWGICGQQFFRAAVGIFFFSWFPTYLQEFRGVSVVDSGLLTSVPLLASLIGGLLGGAVSDWIYTKSGKAEVARKGMALACLSSGTLLSVVGCLTHNPLGSVSLIGAGVFCSAMCSPIVHSLTIAMGAGNVATVFGTMNMSGNLGAAAFPIVVPILLGPSGDNWIPVLWVFCSLQVIAVLFWLLIKPQGTFVGQSPLDQSDPLGD